MKQDSVAVIGAGPYGLASAAHLRALGIPTCVFGKTMEFWQRMPPGMHLKSIWAASSIADPTGEYSLDHFTQLSHTAPVEPVPLPYFVDYGRWFQQRTVPKVDPTYVRLLVRDGRRFRLELEDGRSLRVGKAIVATGIQSFAFVPEFARHLPPELASHSQDHREFNRFKGRSVAVVGRGQSAVQTAAFLHEAGAAEVEMLARGPVIWIDRRLYRYTGPMRRLFYPSSDVGPPGLNWLIHFPQIFRCLPETVRSRVEGRATRPAGAPWLRHRVERLVRITSGVEIVRATAQGERLHCELTDGTTREVDHLVVATGYRPSLRKLGFIDPALRDDLQERDGYPLLNRWFESSVPDLHFVGAVASYNFGPLCRFVAGTKAAGRQIAQRTVSAYHQPGA
jgi:cation diffusion facilitator CzcD-associated flavoprotein CzcO